MYNTAEKDLSTIERQIKKLLQTPIQADYHAIDMTVRENTKISPQLQKRMETVEQMQAGLNALYCLLNENERLVVQRHLVDGLDWSCLGVEFAQIWGAENQKSKRSLMNYLNSALKKMTHYVQENQAVFDFSWLYEL